MKNIVTITEGETKGNIKPPCNIDKSTILSPPAGKKVQTKESIIDKELDDAAKQAINNWIDEGSDNGVRDLFIKGAKWQKEHSISNIELEKVLQDCFDYWHEKYSCKPNNMHDIITEFLAQYKLNKFKSIGDLQFSEDAMQHFGQFAINSSLRYIDEIFDRWCAEYQEKFTKVATKSIIDPEESIANNAQEFAVWCSKNKYIYYEIDKLWQKNNEFIGVPLYTKLETITTSQLYKKWLQYKNKKNGKI